MTRALALLLLPSLAGANEAVFFRSLRLPTEGLFIPAAAPRPAESVRDRVAAALAASRVPLPFIDAAFADARLRFDPQVIARATRPSEALPYERYRLIFITEARVAAGARFHAAQKPLLERVQARYGVDPLLLSAIVGVETFYGTRTGQFEVFNALYTLAEGLPARSAFAVRELAEFLKLCHAQRFDPYSIKGSYAGAFGFGQFIPSTFNGYAQDFDGDGVKRFDEFGDVLASMSWYLRRNGYQPGNADLSPGSPTWRAVHAYNHSDAYVRVVLELRAAIAQRSN